MEEILKTLVEIPSVPEDKEQIGKALEYIDRFLSERGMFVRRLESNGVESLVATTRRTKEPKILLAAHVDVVAGSKDMFEYREENGRCYGRGVADMKFAIAAFMQVVDDLQESLHLHDFGITITSDEEIGGYNGTGAVVRDGYRPQVVILPDAGDSPDSWRIERSAKGKLALELKTKGWSAHGSRPWAGDSAIDKLTSLLDDIRKLFNDQGPETNTMTVATIKGGEADNMVATNAIARLDIRTVSNKDMDKIHDKVLYLGKKYEAEIAIPYPSLRTYITDMENVHVKRFIQTTKEVVTNYKLLEAHSYGATDARFFADVDVPVIVFSPPVEGYHAPVEWIAKDGLTQTRDVLKLYIQRYASILTSDEEQAKQEALAKDQAKTAAKNQ